MLKRLFRQIRCQYQVRTDPVGYARSIGVKLGQDCLLVGLKIGTFGSEPYLVTLGDHVAVASGVRFITHDGGVHVFRYEFPDLDVFGPITMGNNVFIGINVILMPGVKIGDNCVIGTGAVVTHDIPPNSVAVGVPAKVIKTLDGYREGVLKRAMHIKFRPEAERRRILEEKFRQEQKP